MEPMLATEKQRRLSKVLLDACEGMGMALAGSSAIREHGLISRPTEDIDLFAPVELMSKLGEYEAMVSSMEEALARNGYSIVGAREEGMFRHYDVSDGESLLKVDVSIDYRESPTVMLGVGETLALDDAVANKVCAVFSRAEPRDYLDLDSIRRNGPFSDAGLIELAARNDLGFDAGIFASMISRVEMVTPRQVERYGVSAAELDAIKGRYRSWHAELTAALSQREAHEGPAPGIEQAKPKPAHTVADVAKRARERASGQKAQGARNDQRDLGRSPARRQQRR